MKETESRVASSKTFKKNPEFDANHYLNSKIKLNQTACKRLCSQILNLTIVEFRNPSYRHEVERFLRSTRFELYCALADIEPSHIIKLLKEV